MQGERRLGRTPGSPLAPRPHQKKETRVGASSFRPPSARRHEKRERQKERPCGYICSGERPAARERGDRRRADVRVWVRRWRHGGHTLCWRLPTRLSTKATFRRACQAVGGGRKSAVDELLGSPGWLPWARERERGCPRSPLPLFCFSSSSVRQTRARARAKGARDEEKKRK